MPHNLEDVFRVSGIPSVTFVQPEFYTRLRVAVRTPGRGIVIEGPSGIGKTTAIEKILAELGMDEALSLSARTPVDVDLIAQLPEMGDLGTVIVDDFHRLEPDVKAMLGDLMKVLADRDDARSKLILIGINKAGEQLVKGSDDLGLRIDVFRLGRHSEEKLAELIELGEAALNVTFYKSEDIAQRSEGSFQIAQMLCHNLCLQANISETCSEATSISTPVDVVVETAMVELGRLFVAPLLIFARGSKLRREGRAPYLHMLRWLAEADEWSLDLTDALARNPNMRASISQVLDKGYLTALLQDVEKGKALTPLFHFEPTTSILSIEDPRLVFYLKNLVWRAFTRLAGYTADYFNTRYDIALSFAGADRGIAEALTRALQEREISCFYDHDEQHRILSRNVEAYLGPIYRSDSRYIVALLSMSYPERVWTKFESDAFRSRFGEDSVIPIRFRDVQPGWISEEQLVGSLPFDPKEPMEAQVAQIADVIARRLIADREEGQQEASVEPARAKPMGAPR